MKHTNPILFLLIALTFFVLPDVQAQRKKNQPNQKALNDSILYAAQRKSAILFSDGLREKLAGNDDKAIEKFEAALTAYPEDHGSMYELSDLFARKSRFDEALEMMENAVRLQAGNEWYQIRLAQLYKVKGDYKSFAKVYRNLLKIKPDNIEYSGELSSALVLLEEYDEALSLLNSIEKQIGVNEVLSFQKQAIFLVQNQPLKAIQEIENLSAAYPYEARYLAMLADLYKKNGPPEKALDVYRRMVALDPNDPYAHITLAEYYRDQGKEPEAFESLLTAFASKALDVDNKIQIMVIWFEGQATSAEVNDKIERIARVLLEAHPESPRGYQLLADVMLRREQFTEAREAILKSFDFDKNNYQMWESLLIADIQLLDFPTLNDHAGQAISLFPEQPLPYLFNGMALFQLKNYEEAVKFFETGRKFVVRNDMLLAEFYSHIGDTRQRMNDNPASDAAYEKSLSINPENALVLNNYAYFLSLRGEHLDRAKQMSEKSLQLQPENASYLDTYAWILFKLKDYSKALTWIEKALEKTEQANGTLYEHHGDILFHLNRIEEAVNAWKKALEAGETSELIHKKINEMRYYE